MTAVNWTEEVNARKDSMIKDMQEFLKIKSVLDEENGTADSPLGKGIKEALQYMLDLGEKDGFSVKNVGNLAGHIEFGEGEESVGILCHVDVVPEGDGWSSDPFAAEIRDGKIYARGAVDDKGPTIAAYYAMKIVKDLGLPLHRRVRMIIGTDEESNWRCVNHYFEHEEMPTFGFAPDAEFPIINAEKGISDVDLVQMVDRVDKKREAKIEVISYESGQRYNMVPDFATATLKGNLEGVKRDYESFLKVHDLQGKCEGGNDSLTLEVRGVSAHGMEPEKGKNAGLYLAEFLSGLDLEASAAHYFNFVSHFFFRDSRGKMLNIAFADNRFGDLTVNVGKMFFKKEEGGSLGLNIRYPVTSSFDELRRKLAETSEKEGFSLGKITNSRPHHVSEDNFLVQTLKKVYEEQTGEKAELIAIGGGTYARSLKSGVAFGPVFPGRPDVAHQKDEYVVIDELLKATAIYAQAIYELAK